jgi:hypothetical protein
VDLTISKRAWTSCAVLNFIAMQPPKNQRELQDCAHDLDIQLRKIGKMLSVRWVAFSFRSVFAVYNHYVALYHHFILAAAS